MGSWSGTSRCELIAQCWEEALVSILPTTNLRVAHLCG